MPAQTPTALRGLSPVPQPRPARPTRTPAILSLTVNEEIRSRITYSTQLPRLAPEDIQAYILKELDRAGLGHNVFTEDALGLMVRSSEGLLRRARNLCVSALIEAVRDQVRHVDLKQVNHVLLQPHWRKNHDQPLP